MMNIGVGVLITNGLGSSGYNVLGGMFHWVIEDITPPPVDATGRGYAYTWENPTPKIYKITFTTKLTKYKTIKREFIVDETKKDYILKRIGKINTVISKFNIAFEKLSRIFEITWKK